MSQAKPIEPGDEVSVLEEYRGKKPGRSIQEVGTPREFLDAVQSRFGTIAWDLAADESNHVVDDWLGPGRKDPIQRDALYPDCSWDGMGGLLWLNPPYANIGWWVEKCAVTDDARIALLVPASVGTNWFAEHVDRKALVLFLRPRLMFVGHRDPYPKDLMLAVYGEKPGYECWRWR